MRFTTQVAAASLFGVALAGWMRDVPPPPHAGRGLPGGALVAWSPGYRVAFFGIEKLHPFDIGKMDRIAAHLVDEGLVEPSDFAVAEPVSDATLARVHDPAYLASLHDTRVLARALEVGVPDIFPRSVVESRVRTPFRRAVGGTVLAARGALEHGLGINLGGGYHHARPALGHGFCIYNDVALALATLRDAGFDGHVLIVDTDAHQGDGDHAFFTADPTVTTVSLHQGDLFPEPKVPGNVDVELAAGASDAVFLARLDEVLAAHLDPAPALVVHVAGADVLHDDPLAELAMTVDGLVERDLRVLRAARSRDVPVLHLLAGGYGPSAAEAQAKSVAAMLREVRRP